MGHFIRKPNGIEISGLRSQMRNKRSHDLFGPDFVSAKIYPTFDTFRRPRPRNGRIALSGFLRIEVNVANTRSTLWTKSSPAECVACLLIDGACYTQPLGDLALMGAADAGGGDGRGNGGGGGGGSGAGGGTKSSVSKRPNQQRMSFNFIANE